MKVLSFFATMWYKDRDIAFLSGEVGGRWEDMMKRYWKKFTAILLVLLMVLSGCGKGNDNKGTDAGTTEAETLPPLIQIENIEKFFLHLNFIFYTSSGAYLNGSRGES